MGILLNGKNKAHEIKIKIKCNHSACFYICEIANIFENLSLSRCKVLVPTPTPLVVAKDDMVLILESVLLTLFISIFYNKKVKKVIRLSNSQKIKYFSSWVCTMFAF